MILTKLERLRPRERLGLVVMMAAVLLWGADRVLVVTVVDQLKRMDMAITTAKKTMVYHRDVLARKDATSREFARIGDLLGRVSSPEIGVADMKGELDELARKTGVAVSSMEHREPRSAKYYDEYLVEIGKFESSMKSFLDFLRELQVSAGMLRVVKLNLIPGTGSDQVRGSMLITKIMLPEPAPAPKAASANPRTDGRQP